MTITDYLALPLETQRNLLKEKLSETVPRGEVKETAFAAGLNDYTLYKARDPECESHNLIRPELLGIMHHRRDLRLLDFMESLFGRAGFTIPKPLETMEDIGRHITRVFQEASRACQTIVDSVEVNSPGGAEITWEEFKEIRREITAAHQQLAALEEATRRKSQKHHSWPLRLVARIAGGVRR